MSTGILSGYALAAFMTVLPADQSFANPEQEALNHIGKACYKQFDMDKYVKNIERKYINKEVRKYGGAIGIGVRIIAEQRVSVSWKF